MVNIHADTVNNVPILTIEGRLDTLNSEEFEKATAGLLKQGNHLVIHFGKCSYLSSSGIRVLISVTKQISSREHGQLVLAEVPEEVSYVLEMAGIKNLFTLVRDQEEAIELVLKNMNKNLQTKEVEAGQWLFDHHIAAEKEQPAYYWQDQGIAGYDELGFSAGIGMAAEIMAEAPPASGLFFTTGTCAGFVPHHRASAPDFRISMEPLRAGIWVKEAISFNKEPNAVLQLKNFEQIDFNEMISAIRVASGKILPGVALIGYVLVDRHPENPSLYTGLISEANSAPCPGSGFFSCMDEAAHKDQPVFTGGLFKLDKLNKQPAFPSLEKFLQENIRLDNIRDFSTPDKHANLTRPIVWLFFAKKTENAATKRIQIEAHEDFFSTPHNAFLTRRLYQDSSKLVLKQLQGGFSAKTYQVTSYDHNGRKLRPTVLKLADRQIIQREADRCREYAMPYILNNSAMILGTEFFGNAGALRYNFVGIGGEQSKLKWLTHYFLEWPAEKLEPLFNKIFLKILNPWYGQTVIQNIFPFRDHDPSKTFFPDIFDKAFNLLGISSDDQTIIPEETKEEMINPYWYLKHKFPSHYGFSMEYPESICHGDLNMQNILLDEQMNVYLIDFSETRPRAVVSDFARLEAVFMLEFSPLETTDDFLNMVELMREIYNTDRLDQCPEGHGIRNEAFKRNVRLTRLMRQYAFASAGNNPDPIPYTIALLEWVLPVVNYVQASLPQKKLSMIAASFLCKKLMEWID